MAVDIIMKAKRRREQLVTELARIDAFLALAAELAREEGDWRKPSAPTPRRATPQGAAWAQKLSLQH